MKKWSLQWVFKFVYIPLFFYSAVFAGNTGRITAFESKWDRVLELGKEITQGSVADRLWKKEEILSILLKQEESYPIYYVNVNATGKGDGSSWKDAFTQIPPAIDKAAESEGWVWVARGIYNGITIKSRVMVFGGFVGNEKYLAARDYELNETIIQGGPDMRGVDMEHLTLIDGFTIRNSSCKDIIPEKWADVAGGGIRTMSWFSIIRNNRITGNYAQGGGGIAIWCMHQYQRKKDYAPIVENNFIYDNHAICGAGVQIRNSEALFCNNVVAYNTHETRSKGVEIVINPDSSDKPIIVNSILWANAVGSIFTDLYNHFDYVTNYGDAAKAISLYNCIQKGGYGVGLVKSNPLFTDPQHGDFSLRNGSPCIDAGDPDGPPDPDGSRADIGVCTLRYQLFINDGGVGANVVGEGWYLPGTLVRISTDSLAIDSLGTTRYTFVRWEGKGAGSYTGDSLTAYVRMDSAITETAVWKTDYWLQVRGVDPDTLSGWYSADTFLTLTVPSLIQKGEDERLCFVNWSGEGSGSYTGPDTSIAITMVGPINETAHWQLQYFLTVTPFPSYAGEIEFSPQGPWYDDKSEVQLEAVPKDTNIVFIGWSGDASGVVNPLTLLMDGPKNIVANFNATSNFSPHILGIPDTTIFEDNILSFPCSQYVSDFNDPFDSLRFVIENDSHFSLTFDTSDAQLLFIPEANWYGTETIILEVTDPWGFSATDTFTVEVLSVNDPPGSFRLLSPADGTVIPDSANQAMVTFTWQQSANVDSDDAINYEFFLARDSLLSKDILSINVTSDTTFALMWDGIGGEVYWGVRAVDSFDSSCWSTPKSFSISVLTEIENRGIILKRFVLYQNYPNPFNPETTIKYQLPRPGKVKLEALDILGHIVRTIVDENMDAGVHKIIWDGRDEMNRPLSSGIYFIRIKAGNFVQQRKVILLR